MTQKEEAKAHPFMLNFINFFIKVFGIPTPLAKGEFKFRLDLDDKHNGCIDYTQRFAVAYQKFDRAVLRHYGLFASMQERYIVERLLNFTKGKLKANA